MGLTVYVYRDAGESIDCTLGGISSTHNRLWLANVEGPTTEPPEGAAPAVLQSHVKGCLRIVPARNVEGSWVAYSDRWWMMGGNFASTADSRFSDKCAALLGHKFYGAVAIHDRHEG